MRRWRWPQALCEGRLGSTRFGGSQCLAKGRRGPRVVPPRDGDRALRWGSHELAGRWVTGQRRRCAWLKGLSQWDAGSPVGEHVAIRWWWLAAREGAPGEGVGYVAERRRGTLSTGVRLSLQVSERVGGRADREQGSPVDADLLQRLREGLRQLHVRGHEQARQHQRQHHPVR